jgi:nucleotide-binding universal stress UspA family protein
MKRILVGVDGSPESALAAEKAAELAQATEAQLDLIYVVPRRLPPGPDAYVRTDEERRELVEHQYAAALLAEAERKIRRPGLVVNAEAQTGAVAETLSDLADSRDADLIVVGYRGLGAVTRALLGSVAQRVSQISSKPVLVVR